MAASTSQRVSIIIILVIFAVLGLGGTLTVLLGSDKEKPAVTKTQLQGNSMPNFTPIQKIEKLEIKDLKVGDGQEAKPTDTITAHYTGAVAATGIVFQSSKDTGEPATFPLNQVIKGWTQGVPGMKVGGTRRLHIPAELAYGAEGRPDGGIPANADLVFDIELVRIEAAIAE